MIRKESCALHSVVKFNDGIMKASNLLMHLSDCFSRKGSHKDDVNVML